MKFGDSRLGVDTDYRHEELVKKIESALAKMTVAELEALSYDMFTKGYIKEA